MKSYPNYLWKIGNKHTEKRIILNRLYIYSQIILVPSAMLHYLWIVTAPDRQLPQNEAFLSLYTNTVGGDIILWPELWYSTLNHMLLRSYDSVVKTWQKRSLPFNVNQEQLLIVFSVVFQLGNILDVLGIKGKGNLPSDYKLRQTATFIYIV